MKINLAHLREKSTSGSWIDFAVFDAKATSSSTSARENVLQRLTNKARVAGLKIDKSALAYSEGGQMRFFGTSDLVDYLAKNFEPRWTHQIDD